MKPLCIDLYAGLGGWTEGFLAEGYDVVGFDITRHAYGDQKYPAQLVLQDVLTIHGSQFKDAAVIVCSPPCQNYSYLAMPWSRSKSEHSQKAKALRRKWETEGPDNRLFDACFRIQREACGAAGRYIPLIVENVRGAQEWVGRAKGNYGSFYFWGDVAMVGDRLIAGAVSFGIPGIAAPRRMVKVVRNHVNHRDGAKSTKHLTNPAERQIESAESGTKIGGDWFSDPNSTCRKHGSKSKGRKAASAQIAKIPLPLSRWIAQVYKPREEAAA